MSVCSTPNHEDFYRYTSGRWLWDEEEQLRNRYKRFDVAELKRVAASCSEADTCVSMIKLAEVGFNKAFKLVMDNGSTMIARIPYPNATPLFQSIASEVATMNFAHTILEIPVPKVLAWCGKKDNPVESEYILMEEATGTQLAWVWDDMKLRSKLQIVDDIVSIERKFLLLSFTRYGNLYFADNAFPGCEKAEVVGNVSQSLKDQVKSRFVIGPVAHKRFWDGERARMTIDRGPWRRPQDYLKAIAQREITWLSNYAPTRPTDGSGPKNEAQRSPDAHIDLYKKFQDVADFLLPDSEELARSTIWHWDVRTPNIVVDRDRITSLIDWQDVWAGLLCFQAQQPALVRYNGEVMLRLPQHFEAIHDEDERVRVRTQVAKSIVLWTYETETKEINQLLHKLYNVPHGRTKRNTVDFCANTWDGDIIPFRQCLIRIERYWNEINHGNPCPIKFTAEELEAYYRDREGWNEFADFWAALKGFVTRDGWTTHDYFEHAVKFFDQLKKDDELDTSEGEERLNLEI